MRDGTPLTIADASFHPSDGGEWGREEDPSRIEVRRFYRIRGEAEVLLMHVEYYSPQSRGALAPAVDGTRFDPILETETVTIIVEPDEGGGD